MIMPEQDERFDADVWEEPIAKFLAKVERTTIGEVAGSALSLDTNRVSGFDQNLIRSIMTHLGWENAGKGSHGVRWWKPRNRAR